MEETELRARLERLAERTAPPRQDPGDLTARVVSRHHAERRRSLALATVAALLAAVFVGVPVWLSRTADGPGPAGPAAPSGVFTTPTRGDLSGEATFVDGVRQLPWRNAPGGADEIEPTLDTRHVVWAGGVAGERWVLVAGADPDGPLPQDEDGDGQRDLDGLDSVAIAWFSGPAEAAPEKMTLFSVPRVVDADEPAAIIDSASGAVVIVAAPGDRIELSPSLRIEPDGTPRREYEPVADRDGIAVQGDIPVASLDRAMRYRVIRDGEPLTGTYDSIPNPDHRFPTIELTYLRPAPPPAPGDRAVSAAVDDLFGRTGITAPFVPSFTVLWAGDVTTLDGGTARLTLLAVEYPEDNGPYYVTGALGFDAGDGRVETTSCGSEFRPRTTPLDRSVFVIHCGGRGGGPGDAPMESLVVVAPTGSTTARAMNGNGRVLAEYALTDGVAVARTPEDLATVEVLDADATLVDDRAPMETADFGD